MTHHIAEHVISGRSNDMNDQLMQLNGHLSRSQRARVKLPKERQVIFRIKR